MGNFSAVFLRLSPLSHSGTARATQTAVIAKAHGPMYRASSKASPPNRHQVLAAPFLACAIAKRPELSLSQRAMTSAKGFVAGVPSSQYLSENRGPRGTPSFEFLA